MIDKGNLPVTTRNNTTTLNVPDALSSSRNSNVTIIASNIDLDTPIPSSHCPYLLSLDSEKKKNLEIEALLAQLKYYVNYGLWILSNKTDSFTANLKFFFTCFKTDKSNVAFLLKNIVFLQNERLAKDQIIESLLGTQAALLIKQHTSQSSKARMVQGSPSVLKITRQKWAYIHNLHENVKELYIPSQHIT